MRRFFSILLLIVLTIVWPVALLISSVKANVVTNEFVKHELVKRHVYTLALEQIDTQIKTIEIDPGYPITTSDLTTLAHQVFTLDWLQSTTESIIDRFWTWLQAPRGTVLALPLDLRQPKASLSTNLDALLTTKLKELKPCPSTRLPNAEQGICQFAGMNLDQLKAALKQQGLDTDVIGTLLPDTLDLIHPDLSAITGTTDGGSTQQTGEIQAHLDQAKVVYQQILAWYVAGWGAVALIAIAYLALNAWGGLHRIGRWFGILLITISVLPLSLSLLSRGLITATVEPNIQWSSTVTADTRIAALGALHDVQSAIFSPILIVSIIMLITGIVAVILDRDRHVRPKQK